MVICSIFWILACPLVYLTWHPSHGKLFSWEEKLIFTIILFLPVFGILCWVSYFHIPPSLRPDEIQGPDTTNRSYLSGVGFAQWMMAETARQRATGNEKPLGVSDSTRKQWRVLRWPLFILLTALVVWFNMMLVR